MVKYSLSDDTGNEIVVHQLGDGFVGDLFYKNGATQCIVSRPLPLEYCIGTCEDYARENLEMRFSDLSAPWMQTNEPPTSGQIRILKGRTISFKVETKADAAVAIRTMIAQDKRKKRLKKESQWESLHTSHRTH